MKKKKINLFLLPICLFLLFVLFTAAVMTLDVQPIGPEGAEVGMAELNGFVRDRIGTHPFWLHVADVLGYAAILSGCGFAVLGLFQWIRRKKLWSVDRDLFILAGGYLLVVAFYVAFRFITINCRPVLMDGELEPSYPSSHTLLALTYFAMAISQVIARVKKKNLRSLTVALLAVLMAGTVVGRILSGVHWITDIVGGILLSAAVIALYHAVIEGFGTGTVTVADKEN